MSEAFAGQFEALFEKYTELLVGDSSPELQESVKYWIMYTHISKSMPALARHWNEKYPEGKQEILDQMMKIKRLNEQHRQLAAGNKKPAGDE